MTPFDVKLAKWQAVEAGRREGRREKNDAYEFPEWMFRSRRYIKGIHGLWYPPAWLIALSLFFAICMPQIPIWIDIPLVIVCICGGFSGALLWCTLEIWTVYFCYTRGAYFLVVFVAAPVVAFLVWLLYIHIALSTQKKMAHILHLREEYSPDFVYENDDPVGASNFFGWYRAWISPECTFQVQVRAYKEYQWLMQPHDLSGVGRMNFAQYLRYLRKSNPDSSVTSDYALDLFCEILAEEDEDTAT